MFTNFIQFTMSLFVIISDLALATQEIRVLNPYSNSAVLKISDSNISIERIAIVNSPSKILVHYCDEITNCSPTEVLESELVVEVSYRYVSMESHHEADSGTIVSSVRLPLQLFSESEIKQIKEMSDFIFDFTGSKTIKLKKLAQQLISYDIQSITQETKTLNTIQSGCNYMLATSEFFDDYVCQEPKYVDTKVDSQILIFRKTSSK